MAELLSDATLETLITTLISNLGRGSSEKIGENTYEVKDVNKSMREDIDWLQAKQSELDPTIRSTTKVNNRYGY